MKRITFATLSATLLVAGPALAGPSAVPGLQYPFEPTYAPHGWHAHPNHFSWHTRPHHAPGYTGRGGSITHSVPPRQSLGAHHSIGGLIGRQGRPGGRP